MNVNHILELKGLVSEHSRDDYRFDDLNRLQALQTLQVSCARFYRMSASPVFCTYHES